MYKLRMRNVSYHDIIISFIREKVININEEIKHKRLASLIFIKLILGKHTAHIICS